MPASRFTMMPPELLPVTATRLALPLRLFTAYVTIFAMAWLSPPPSRVNDFEVVVYMSSVSSLLQTSSVNNI